MPARGASCLCPTSPCPCHSLFACCTRICTSKWQIHVLQMLPHQTAARGTTATATTTTQSRWTTRSRRHCHRRLAACVSISHSVAQLDAAAERDQEKALSLGSASLRIADFPIPMCQIVAAPAAAAAAAAAMSPADCAVCEWLSRASDIDKLADCSSSDRYYPHIGASETAQGWQTTGGRQAGWEVYLCRCDKCISQHKENGLFILIYCAKSMPYGISIT